MSIRTDIEALTHYAGTGRWQPGERMVDRSKVLDIADQHDKEHATLQSELTQVKTEDPATEHMMMLINKRAELRAMADQLRGERDSLHSDLVQLRVAYAEIEAERNRLERENHRLDRGEFKNWKMFSGEPKDADMHRHRCEICGFVWAHAKRQVYRLDAEGKRRTHRCQNCGREQRTIEDGEK